MASGECLRKLTPSPQAGIPLYSHNRRQPKDPTPAIAISATFTAEALEPTLAFWLRKLKLDYPIRFASYNQVFQQLLDPGRRCSPVIGTA